MGNLEAEHPGARRAYLTFSGGSTWEVEIQEAVNSEVLALSGRLLQALLSDSLDQLLEAVGWLSEPVGSDHG